MSEGVSYYSEDDSDKIKALTVNSTTTNKKGYNLHFSNVYKMKGKMQLMQEKAGTKGQRNINRNWHKQKINIILHLNSTTQNFILSIHEAK